MTIEDWLGKDNELGLNIWHKKYQHNNESFEDWINRISGGNTRIAKLIKEKKFLFGGRILANRGIKDRKLTYSNCYVITPPDDSLESIFECARKLARTFSYGGGCGIDLSKLRPNGAATHNAAKESSGPVSFMDIYSQITGTISQNGRRGALMISLDINHPDIEQFIDCKTDLSKVNYANISVRVNDDFMRAVENKSSNYILSWPIDGYKTGVDTTNWEFNKLYLVDGVYYKKIDPVRLFNKLVENNWNYAEPGILYWDKVENYNLLNNTDFKYAGVNPCAEEPLPPGGSCLLGSLNLAEFVNKDGTIDFDSLEDATSLAIQALNEVLIDGLPLHPLKEQRDSVTKWRQIGLGTMGLADMLIKCGVTYGNKESLQVIDVVYSCIATTAVETSLHLAKIQGCYPECDKDKLIESSFIQALHLPTKTIKDIKKYGLFNSQLLTCAPTGSISTMLQISGGTEPIFAMKYTRTTKSLDGKDTVYDVYTKIADDWLKIHPGKQLPEYFVESKDIKPSDRVLVQSILQKNIDASISSTVNLPEEATVEDISTIYTDAWKQGLKGITIFRQNCARIAILSTNTPKKEEKKAEKKEEKVIFDSILPVSRKKMGVTSGCTFCKKCACGTLYITLNKDKDGNFVELFTHTSKGGICQANLNAETRMASLALRSGVKVSEVVDQLKGISCPACTAVKAKGGKVDGISCADIIAKTIEEFQKKDEFRMKCEYPINDKEAADYNQIQKIEYEECPECHQKTLIREAGCQSCTSCGYSRCN